MQEDRVAGGRQDRARVIKTGLRGLQSVYMDSSERTRSSDAFPMRGVTVVFRRRQVRISALTC